MSRRAEKIPGGSTALERQAQRRKIGALSRQVIQDKTRNRYHQMFQRFRRFHRWAEDFQVPAPEEFDIQVSQFVEHLWETGAPTSAGLCVSRHSVPQTSDKASSDMVVEVSENLEPYRIANTSDPADSPLDFGVGRSSFQVAAVSHGMASHCGVLPFPPHWRNGEPSEKGCFIAAVFQGRSGSVSDRYQDHKEK